MISGSTKLILLFYVACLPGFLPAQFLENVNITSTSLLNPQHEKKRPAQEIADAEAALKRASSQGAQSLGTADAASALANLYLKVGDYERASPLIERALEIRLTSLGGKHRDTAASRQQLAEFREELGAFAEAEKLYRGALSVRQQADSHSLETAATLHALGRLLSKMNNLSEAEQLLRSALAIRKQKLPLNDVETAYLLSELANIEARKGNNSAAQTLLESALKIFETTLGSKDPDTEDARITMQALYETMNEKLIVATQIWDLLPGGPVPEGGNEPARRPLFLSGPFNAREAQRLSDYAEQRLETGNANDRKQALLMQERSLQIRQAVLGPEHPKTLQSLQRLGPAALDQGQYDRALRYAQKAMVAQTHFLRRIFSFNDEQHRLAYQATISPFSLFASLPEVPARDLATAVLRFKGAVLDSLLAERQQADASRDPLLRPMLTRAASAREAWRQLDIDAVAAESEDLSAHDARRAALETEFKEIAQDYARAGLGTGGLAVSTTTSQIASALAPDSVLVEIIRYSHYLGGNRIEDRYGAILLAAAGDPVWVPLGPAAELEKLVAVYQKSVRGETDEFTLKKDLRELHDRLWLPVERVLSRPCRRVIISPDGALNFVSFATLLTQDDHFLAEKVAISYVASGRDIIVEQPLRSAKTLVICAAPDFKAPLVLERGNATQPQTLDPMQAAERDSYRVLNFSPLPGTAQEATALRERAGRWGWEVKTLEGSDALESLLRQVDAPRVLHLATHGFFIAEGEVSAPLEEWQNPMRRAGLALCGAQTTLDLWKRGAPPPAATDGILTAEEVSTLKLNGTWIVTLSACDTGSGEARSGEGVLGLRRGFIRAGAQNLLMTLWPISDEKTVEIILDFYERALATDDAPRALAETQRDWLVKLRDNPAKNNILTAVQLAGPFIMTTQGKQ